ncbi:MAG: ABC transporter ATP-binding protein [Emergencia timonensis]|uniref:ABC transporter ATP-binding protein n=1 Tax=Emergencia timonensis TaxID=1776384 RepID=UPI00082E9DA9|nr:ABC transporter ATP-binding protein [Emergencia timonensis]WNX90684.1 ABC transporter ATP-binding protein [Emergencia timonensis]
MYITINNIKKSYGEGSSFVQVLDGITTQVQKGQICAILGPSGSGKSTLLNAVGGLDTVDSGSIQIENRDITTLSQDALSDYRRDTLGFVFQFYNLIPNLTVQENIEVCSYLSESPLDINELLEILGLTEHRSKFPSQLSGGQQQRCSLARALIKRPKLLLCDEPTGALDSKTAKEILQLLEDINQRFKTTMLIVTHNDIISSMTHKVIKIRDGQIYEEYVNTNRIPAEKLEW